MSPISRHDPPRLARMILRALLPDALRDAIDGDLRERFERMDNAAGARLWYWKQVLGLKYGALRRAAAGLHREDTRTRGDGVGMMIVEELTRAARALKSRPALSGIVVLTLALSIGATTAIFSVVNGVLLRPLPFPESEELVQVYQTNESWRDSSNPQLRAFAERFPLSYPIYEGWRDRQTVFEGIGAYTGGQFTFVGGDEPEILDGTWLTADVLHLLGVAPEIGRLPDREHDLMGAEPVVVLSHRFWRGRMGGDPSVLDQTINLDGIPRPIIGVMPEGFEFGSSLSGTSDLWVTMDDARKSRPGDSQFLRSVARVRDDVDLETATEELVLLQGQLQETFEEPPEEGSRAVNLKWRLEETVGDIRSTLLMLLGSVGVVLAIACANIANLLFVSGMSRRRERAVRAALGAGAGRLVRSQFAETGLLALLGGALGVLLATLLHQPLVDLLPPAVPRQGEILLDGRVFTFSFLLTTLTTLAVGVLPAALAARTDPAEGLKEGGRRSGLSRGALRVRSTLVVAEVALAFVLLVGAGLLGNSLWRLNRVDIGFAPEGLVTFSVSLPEEEMEMGDAERMGPVGTLDPEGRQRFVGELDRRLREIPGVRDVALTTEIPMGGSTSSGGVYVEMPDGEWAEVSLNMSAVSNEYFGVLGIRLMAGRGFDATDVPGSAPTTVINETAATALWPGQNAVGKQLRRGEDESSRYVTVVGVVADVHHAGVRQVPVGKMYTPALASPPQYQDWVIQVAGDPAPVIEGARQAVWAVDPDLPVRSANLMTEVVRSSLAQPRFRTLLVGSLALLAGVLAILGVSGVVAYVVSQRAPEIGVRLALGASPGAVVSRLTRGGLALAALGTLIGLAIAVPASRVLNDFLYEIEALDPVTYGSILILLIAVGGLASWWPARRAASVDPVSVLNAD